MNSPTRKRRLGLWLALVAIGGAAVLTFAVSSGFGGAEATKYTGPPIRVMTIGPVNSNTLSYPNLTVTAKVAGQWINAHGGLKDGNGKTHELIVDACDDRNDPNQVAACGRRAVSSKVTAVVGSYTSNGDKLIPILEAGNTAWFGLCCANAATENTSRVSFPTAGAPAYFAAMGYYAGKSCKTSTYGLIEVPFKDYIQGLTDAGYKAARKTSPTPVLVPAVVGDYSPQVAQLTQSNPECLMAILSNTQWVAFLGAVAQSGWKGTLIGIQGNLDANAASKVPNSVTEGAVDIGAYPDLSSPVFADYRAALKRFKAPKNVDYNAISSLGTWSGYTAFANIVSKMKGPINNKTFLAAASRTKALDTKGQTPPIDFTKQYKAKGLNRIFNRKITLITIRKGKFVPLTNKFYDMTAVIAGRPGPAMPPHP